MVEAGGLPKPFVTPFVFQKHLLKAANGLMGRGELPPELYYHIEGGIEDEEERMNPSLPFDDPQPQLSTLSRKFDEKERKLP